MVLIGLNDDQKQQEIIKYVEKHPIKGVIVFSPQRFFMPLPDLGDIKIRQIEFHEVQMYRTFYPLLEEIDKDYLLIVNEFMRSPARSNLDYNCLRHYLNQCGHEIVFEYFPFINSEEDFMILLDFATKSKHKGVGFSDYMLEENDVRCVNHHIYLSVENVPIPNNALEEYDEKKKELFNTLENKDPDTIPRALEIFCGKWKKPYIVPDCQYVARNARFKLKNITTFPNVERNKNYIILDFLHSRLKMNDYIRFTGQNELKFISTGLSIDEFYINEFNSWLNRLEEFYAKAGIFAGNR